MKRKDNSDAILVKKALDLIVLGQRNANYIHQSLLTCSLLYTIA